MTGTPSGFKDLDEHDRRLPAGQPDRPGGQALDGQERAGRSTSPRTPRSSTTRPSRCSRSRCRRPSSPSASSRRRPRSTATTCARAASSRTAGRRSIAATEKLANAPLYVDDSSDLGILELRAKARRLHSRHELGLIIVDYLQLMRPEDSSAGRVEQIGQISRGLKMLARELSVPVIAVSQLSRAVESRPDKRPLLSDLRESGNIEQDADVVMFIYRDEYYNKESERAGRGRI